MYLYGARVCALCVSAGLRFMSRRRPTYRGGQKEELAPLVFLKLQALPVPFETLGFDICMHTCVVRHAGSWVVRVSPH